jgi:serine/threonine protein kinase
VEENIYVDNYCGTPTYMAPEVVTKTPHNPLLADRWSLGIFLYTMLHGHCPFKAQTQK